MKARLLALGVAAVALAGVAGCGRFESVHSEKQRALPSGRAVGQIKELVRGNSDFAVGLYHQLARGEGNLVFSPYSASLALAMTYAGARGETARQMATALRFYLPQEELHPAFNALDQSLEEIGDGGATLHLANSVWVQKDYPARPEFLDLLAVNYGAGLKAVDFANAPDRAIRAINGWVEDQTRGTIKDLIPKYDARLTRLALADAVYMKAEWKEKFKASDTEPETFRRLDGSRVKVEMMNSRGWVGETLGYAEGPGYQVLDLCYLGDRLSMVFLLPAEGKFRAFEKELSGERLARLLEAVSKEGPYDEVIIGIPKAKFSSDFAFRESLSALGMPQAFSPQADFAGMASEPLFLEEAWQEVSMAVDEEGTEAASATAVMVAASAGPVGVPVPEFIANRPFLFVIRDRETGAILFLGRVMDPRE